LTKALPTSPLTDELVADGRQASATSSRVLRRRACPNCGVLGHYRKKCPQSSPAQQLDAARAEIARLEAETARLVATNMELRQDLAVERRVLSTRSARLELVDEVELNCVHCGRPCERAIVHRERERDQGHAPAVTRESLSIVRAAAAGERVPGRAA